MFLNFKKYLNLFVLLFFFAILPKVVYAQEQFIVDVTVEYVISSTGITGVRQNIVIENATTEYFAKSYKVTLDNISPINIKATQGSKSLNVERVLDDNIVELKVLFDSSIVGKGEKREFELYFEERNFVTKTGEVWEVSIPRLKNIQSYRNYSATLLVPKSFGLEAYLSPEPQYHDELSDYYKYTFNKELVANAGISAGFGEFQVFNFTLKYHLENPSSKLGSTEIALPPDTYFQKVYYEKLEPEPDNIFRDVDGNWIAVYKLSPGERMDVIALGGAQLFSEPSKQLPGYTDQQLSENLKPTKYWQTTDPKIAELARILKTPEKIYNYVSTTLTYDYDRVNPNVERLGASFALNNPGSAICMEFTDLFIALSRAAGIPAREVNGFAYTENPEIEPLSLVADVLHAWPEYWDFENEIWVPVDPTWGSTTGGVDFFNKLDLRHFAFVMHGTDDEKPYPAGSYKLGASPEKDVFVNFGKLPAKRNADPKILTEVNTKIPLLPPTVSIKIRNQGPSALYNVRNEIYLDENQSFNEVLDILLPFTTYETKLKIPFSLMSLKMPEKIKIYSGNSSLEVATGKPQIIVYNLSALLILVFILIIISLARLKKINFNAFKTKKNTSSKK